MALTLAQVANPQSAITEFPFGPFKVRVMDLTFDNSYLTGGEVLTAAQLGWNQVWGALEMVNASNSTGTVASFTVVKANSALSQLTFQLYEGAATANDNPLKEWTSAQDASTYTGRYLIFGM